MNILGKIKLQYEKALDIKKIINELISLGYSYTEIATEVGLSRQRIHQLYTGYKVPYKPNFKKKREIFLNDFIRFEIIKRDNYTCQKCKYKGKWRDANLHVHHLDKTGQTTNSNNAFSNLITLCNKCHGYTHVAQ